MARGAIIYELEHFESLSRTYPATREFVTLLYELFENPHAWKSFESDARVAAIQYYFEFMLEHVFLKFDLQKYEGEEEKGLVDDTLAIFKKILRNTDTSTTEGSLSYQLLARFLSSSPMLNKVLSILSEDGGVDILENTCTDIISIMPFSIVWTLSSVSRNLCSYFCLTTSPSSSRSLWKLPSEWTEYKFRVKYVDVTSKGHAILMKMACSSYLSGCPIYYYSPLKKALRKYNLHDMVPEGQDSGTPSLSD